MRICVVNFVIIDRDMEKKLLEQELEDDLSEEEMEETLENEDEARPIIEEETQQIPGDQTQERLGSTPVQTIPEKLI